MATTALGCGLWSSTEAWTMFFLLPCMVRLLFLLAHFSGYKKQVSGVRIKPQPPRSLLLQKIPPSRFGQIINMLSPCMTCFSWWTLAIGHDLLVSVFDLSFLPPHIKNLQLVLSGDDVLAKQPFIQRFITPGERLLLQVRGESSAFEAPWGGPHHCTRHPKNFMTLVYFFFCKVSSTVFWIWYASHIPQSVCLFVEEGL